MLNQRARFPNWEKNLLQSMRKKIRRNICKKLLDLLRSGMATDLQRHQGVFRDSQTWKHSCIQRASRTQPSEADFAPY